MKLEEALCTCTIKTCIRKLVMESEIAYDRRANKEDGEAEAGAGRGPVYNTRAGANRTGAAAAKVGAAVPRARGGGAVVPRARGGGAAILRARGGGAAILRARGGGAAVPRARGGGAAVPRARGGGATASRITNRASESSVAEGGSQSRHRGHLAGMPRPPCAGPCSQFAALPGTVACLVHYSTPPGIPDVAAQEADVATQGAEVTSVHPADCSAPFASCCAPPEIPEVAAQVHRRTPLSVSPGSWSLVRTMVALVKPSGSLLAGPGSLPGNAGGTNPPSSPPVEEGEN
ncbi:UNVERIFIED_CONTAM: hypothetical protein FKN15_043635 [Acipenser sinensis]